MAHKKHVIFLIDIYYIFREYSLEVITFTTLEFKLKIPAFPLGNITLSNGCFKFVCLFVCLFLLARHRDKLMESYSRAIWRNRIETTGLFRIEGTSVMHTVDLPK